MQYFDQSQSNQEKSIFHLINSSNHAQRFQKSVNGVWKDKWSLPFQMMLTKWGFCFSFNLMPLSELINIDKYFYYYILAKRSLISCSVSLAHDTHSNVFGSNFQTENIPLGETIPWKAYSRVDELKMNIDFPPDDQILQIYARRGFRFIIHPTDELPSDSSFHFFQQLQLSSVHFTPQQVLMDENLKLLSFEQRNCYLENEKTLEMFQTYSKGNCKHECLSKAFAENCGCVPFYLLSKKHFEIFFSSMSISAFQKKFKIEFATLMIRTASMSWKIICSKRRKIANV